MATDEEDEDGKTCKSGDGDTLMTDDDDDGATTSTISDDDDDRGISIDIECIGSSSVGFIVVCMIDSSTRTSSSSAVVVVFNRITSSSSSLGTITTIFPFCLFIDGSSSILSLSKPSLVITINNRNKYLTINQSIYQ